ncbi:MAG: dynamin family GTPase [Hyperionvirus sp.]|uniref:Dynamin family GTPase n=1 Tax=Hyperionvirus sp. TaxID=2487770 RepID=A0A3G5A8L0_9VIRU|nr:MAG: dynamin family GTPase [Hyperionvirus sp.]
MDNKFTINIAIVGAVSVGKSTLLNALFVEHYSEMRIKRNTMRPQVYVEEIDTEANPVKIKESNRLSNEELISKTERGEKLSVNDIQELEYNVPKLYNFAKLQKGITLSIFDIPGLNDSRTKIVYFDYLTTNIHKFDIVIFLVDICSAFNTMDEINILDHLLSSMKKCSDIYKTENNLIVLVNKCDDMTLSNLQLQLDPELEKMFVQVQTTVQTKIKDIYPTLKCSILPISCESSFVYRIYKRYPSIEIDQKYANNIGQMQWGKVEWNKLSDNEKKIKLHNFMETDDHDIRMQLTGFNSLKCVIHELFSERGLYNYLINRPKYEFYMIMHDNDYVGDIDFVNLEDQLTRLAKCEIGMRSINSAFYGKYMNEQLPILEKYIEKLIYSFNVYIQKRYSKYIPKNDLAHTRYDGFRKNFLFIRQQFRNVWDQINCEPTYKKIVENINKFCLTKVKTENDLDYLLKLVDQLIKNGYSDWKKVLLEHFSNVCSLGGNKGISPHKLEMIRNRYDLNPDDILDISLKMLYQYYKKEISTIKLAISNKSDDIVYFLEISQLWERIILSHDNKYCGYIHIIRNTLRNFAHWLDSNETISLYKLYEEGSLPESRTDIEKLLIIDLKTLFPTQVFTYDELIATLSTKNIVTSKSVKDFLDLVNCDEILSQQM